MDKHTFKVGDRVIYTDSSLKTHVGAKGQYWEGTHDGGTLTLPGVKFDNDNLNRLVYNREFFSVWSHGVLKHDTDFQVGDWVRYEQTHKTIGTPKAYGEIGKIERIGTFASVAFPSVRSEFLLENLVKIQPPKEEEEKKNMYNVFSITHEKYGVVQGVNQVAPGCYCKNGAHYYHGEGWREVEEWVKIEVRKAQWDNVNKCCNVLEVQKKSEDYPDTCTLSWRYPQ